jgi:hypothetical protein
MQCVHMRMWAETSRETYPLDPHALRTHPLCACMHLICTHPLFECMHMHACLDAHRVRALPDAQQDAEWRATHTSWALEVVYIDPIEDKHKTEAGAEANYKTDTGAREEEAGGVEEEADAEWLMALLLLRHARHLLGSPSSPIFQVWALPLDGAWAPLLRVFAIAASTACIRHCSVLFKPKP